ncbi:hypothetical protein GGS21DRAFT_105749 [Xylaria nigripes]|nr:hypothetical protein GGS21DRAFT_105749 [Xylaria nigripes]
MIPPHQPVMQDLPFIQVKDLAPSASFYSAVTQPLGLRFVSANASSIVFGSPNPVFEVKATPANADSPRPTRLVFSAGLPAAVSAFHAAAKRANPEGNSNIVLRSDGATSECYARVSDLDGNIMEVRHDHASRKEIRILDWNQDVANPVVAARPATCSGAPQQRLGLASKLLPSEDETYKVIRRSFTGTSTVGTSPRPQHNAKSLSTSSVLGTVLGAVAAGAAVGAGLTYALSRREREYPQESDEPPYSRRPAYSDSSTDQQNRYVEMERTVEKLRYSEPRNSSSSPVYTARDSRPDTSTVVEDLSDIERTRRRSPGSRTRDRSSSSSIRRPLMLTDADTKSTISSQTPGSPRVPAEAEPRSPTRSAHGPKDSKSQVHTELVHRHRHGGSKLSTKTHSRHDHDHHRSHGSRSKHDEEHRGHTSSRSKHDDDRRSHVSSRLKNHDSERRSHGSSRHGSVRPRRDTDEEAMSFVSARSDKTATTTRPSKPKPEPPSRSSSSVSMGGAPLSKDTPPPSRAIPPPPPNDMPPPPPLPSKIPVPQRYVALPPRGVQLASRGPPLSPRTTEWKSVADDDSVAPDDSISCVEERPRPHARDLPFLQMRERLIIQ